MKTVFPLYIDPKIDNPKRLSLLSGVPEKYFTSASDFNKILAALKQLSIVEKTDSKILIFDKITGYIHVKTNNTPLTGELTLDLTVAVEQGNALVHWTRSGSDLVINGAIIWENDPPTTDGDYRILFYYSAGKVYAGVIGGSASTGGSSGEIIGVLTTTIASSTGESVGILTTTIV